MSNGQVLKNLVVDGLHSSYVECYDAYTQAQVMALEVAKVE